jgi:hypothetical protein
MAHFISYQYLKPSTVLATFNRTICLCMQFFVTSKLPSSATLRFIIRGHHYTLFLFNSVQFACSHHISQRHICHLVLGLPNSFLFLLLYPIQFWELPTLLPNGYWGLKFDLHLKLRLRMHGTVPPLPLLWCGA